MFIATIFNVHKYEKNCLVTTISAEFSVIQLTNDTNFFKAIIMLKAPFLFFASLPKPDKNTKSKDRQASMPYLS